MFEKRFTVPAGATKMEIILPLPENVLPTGRRYIEIKEGAEESFLPISGGPVTIKVVKVGRPSHGVKSVIIQSDELKSATLLPALDCRKKK